MARSFAYLLAATMVIASSSAAAQETRVEWTQHARAALADGRFDDAESALGSASASPDDASVDAPLAASWADLGDAFFRRGDPDRAVRAYARALLLVPGEPRYHAARGWALDAAGHADAARDEIAAARHYDAASPDARALERHMDDAVSFRTAFFVAGGVTIGTGVVLAVVAAIVGAVTRESGGPLGPPPDASVLDWLVGTGIVVALTGIVLAVMGEVLHVGASELPRRAPVPLALVIDGGAWLGLGGAL